MDIQFVTESDGDAIAVMAGAGAALMPAAQALDAKAGGALTKAIKASRFNGAAGQVLDILAPQGVPYARILLIGMGEPDRAEPMAVERFGGHAVRRTLASGAERLVLAPDALPQAAIAEAGARAAIGARLAAYRFDRYRTKQKPDSLPSLKEIHIALEGPAAARARYEKSSGLVEGVTLARDLVSEPPNVLYPASFVARVKEVLEPHGVAVQALGVEEMRALGMGALIGVGQGSTRESQLMVMSWNGAKAKSVRPVALVGKGVTFDTGGISIKPSAGMDEMKGDMGGAGAVAGAMLSLAMRKAKANVVGVVALVENMPDGNAQRPGDIVTTMSGQTIEVLNTDAEGRLILADAIWYAQEKHNPVAIVDLATLTGAIITSLGHEYAGLFSNDDDLANSLQSAASAEGEPLWRLPLSPGYDKMMDSPNADMKNISGKPAAGSITAAQFIKRFVKDGTPWAHLDIAGVAWKPGPYEDPLHPAWATGYGVRLLNRFVANRYEE